MSEILMDELISSKDIFLLIKDTLSVYDERPMNHGMQSAYILYNLLKARGGYEEYEIVDICFVALLQDVGIYKTEYLNIKGDYETADISKHSVYGYLMFRYLSPYPDYAKMLLYHHVHWDRLQGVNYAHKDLAQFLHISSDAASIIARVGKRFSLTKMIETRSDKYMPEVVKLFQKVMMNGQITVDLLNGDYEEKMKKVWDYALLSDTEKSKLSDILMFSIGFRDEVSVMKAIASVYACREIGSHMKLTEEDREALDCAAILHDIGMLSIPSSIISAPRQLTKEERAIVRTHVDVTRELITPYVPARVADIACAHHERFDGSGYPLGLKGGKMNDLQAILQVADTVAALINARTYAGSLTNEEICTILLEDADNQKLNKMVVDTTVVYFDQMMKRIKPEMDKIRETYLALKSRLEEQVQAGNKLT